MRYHYSKANILASGVKAVKDGTFEANPDARFYLQYICDHPVYDKCTLYRIEGRGLAVIQQRFNRIAKSTYWDALDSELAIPIYLHRGFKAFFDKYAGEKRKDGTYPTVTVRQIMWALRMKPLKKERWETVFDHKDI